jgi:hypothetical protein
MPEILERRRNWAPWMAFLFILLAVALNVWTFVAPLRWTLVLVWLSFAAGLCALVYAALGASRAFKQPQVFGGKISSSIFSVLAILVCGLMALGWFSARALPASAGAPRVGQKAPEFTLADTQGNKVSLSQLLAGDPAAASHTGGAPTKAVLLIFYRGYW